MKFALFLLQGALVAAVAVQTDEDSAVLNELKNSPHMMSRRSYKVVERLVKRAEKPAKTGSGPLGLPASFAYVAPPNAPKSLVPDVQMAEKATNFPTAIMKKIRYGPYRLPSIKEKNVQSTTMAADGMMDAFVVSATKPCDACVLAAINADLEYADGTLANTTTGAWLHHTVLLNSGPGITDTNCQKSKTESVFESGNEKMIIPLSLGEEFMVKTGYKVAAQDKFILINEFQNKKEEEQYVWLTMTYEYFDGVRDDFKSTKMLWLSLGPNICNPAAPNPFGKSNLTAMGQPESKVFTESSIPWVSPYGGMVVGTGGHLHDGGTHLRIFQNDEEICDAEPIYGAVGEAGGMGTKSDGQQHITMMEACASLKSFQKGDTFHLRADYDFNKHEGMENNKGEMDGIMGISAVLLAV